MRRETRQMSLAEALVDGGKAGGGKGGARLDRIAEALDWSELDAIMAELRSASTGRPGWPPLAMLEALLLAQWYGLSDPETRGRARRPAVLPAVRRAAARRRRATRRRSAGSGTSSGGAA